MYCKQSSGGKANGIKLRKEAIEKYYKNPNRCGYCGAVIEVREGEIVAEVKRKKYCNRTCAALYNSPRQNKLEPKQRCLICGKKLHWASKGTRCLNCRRGNSILLEKTKGELFSNKSWQNARSGIQRVAGAVFRVNNPSPVCVVCGYDKHVEVAHIKPVSKFEDAATVKEINSPNNLVGLCPNHHWEFDNGLLLLRDGVIGNATAS